MSINDGGPAFPGSSGHSDPRNPGWVGGGLSLRDYFAAHVLNGTLASDSHVRMANKYDTTQRPALLLALAELCYEFADAMLAARSKTT